MLVLDLQQIDQENAAQIMVLLSFQDNPINYWQPGI